MRVLKRLLANAPGPTLLVLLCVAVFAGCAKREESTTPPETITSVSPNAADPTDTDRQVFQVRGVVKEIKSPTKVSIAHEEIPNYMVAMTMDFDVKNTNELVGLGPNDQVTFTMVVTDDDGWIQGIRKVGVDANATKTRPSTRLVREVEPLAVGDKMTDYTFTNSLGQKMSLSDLNGQAYAFTFIFTRCPFPVYCPRMNSNFAAAYEELSKLQSGPTNWHLISISFDPDFDTPERLAAYSATYKPDPKKWSWVTGAMIDIDAITEQLGLLFAFENGTFSHNLRTVVVDKSGVIRQIFNGNEWKVEDFVKEIVAGAEGKEIGKY